MFTGVGLGQEDTSGFFDSRFEISNRIMMASRVDSLAFDT